MDDKEFKKMIQECMMYKDPTGIKKLILEDKYNQEDQFWELLGILGEGVSEDNYNASFGFFDACEHCLKYLVRVGNPKELLLALLEQGDTLNDPIRFQTYLQLIQEVLLRLPSKRVYSLELSLETLHEVIRNLELPANLDLEGEERRAQDLDPDVDKINRYLLVYIDFLKNFKDESLKEQDKNGPKPGTLYRKYLNTALLRLLNHPLVYFDLTVHSVNERVVRSNSRVAAERISYLLCELNTDIVELIEECLENKENIKRLQARGSIDEVEVPESTPMLSLACLSYLMYRESVIDLKCSCLYSCQGNLENNLVFVLELMKHQKSGVHAKGVMLLNSLIQQLDKSTSLGYEDLDRPEYFQIFDAMFDVMVHSPVRETRRSCVGILESLIKVFDMKARYQIYVKIFGTLKHSGVYGHCVHLFKNQLEEVLNAAETGSKELELFCGLNLKKVLLLVTSLPDDSATDMVEHSDRLIADLNLIRYLVLRDPPSKNRTGFWNYFPILEKDFLKPVQVGLDMSKGHYKCELVGLESGKVEKSENKDVEMSVSVAGFSLPKMDKVQKMEILKQALNTLDLMTSLFVRVTELIDQKKREKKEPIPCNGENV